MNAPTKYAALQAYRLILYRRALHPELFNIKQRRTLSHGEYEFEAWLMPSGHLMRFQTNGACATEIVTCDDLTLPERGLVTSIPCAGEKEYEHAVTDKLNYLTSVQTETLPANLYAATYEELVEFGQEHEAMVFEWRDDEGGACVSILDVQRFRREVHAQAYHLLAPGGIVLRSQTIFEHK